MTVAFLGLSLAANRMLFYPAAKRLPRGEPSAWMVVPVVAGVAVLVLLGVHPPADLTGLLDPGRRRTARAGVTAAPAGTRSGGRGHACRRTLAARLAAGARFAGLFGTAIPGGPARRPATGCV